MGESYLGPFYVIAILKKNWKLKKLLQKYNLFNSFFKYKKNPNF
jgi:hypothetical protein